MDDSPDHRSLSRREFLRIAIIGISSLVLHGCSLLTESILQSTSPTTQPTSTTEAADMLVPVSTETPIPTDTSTPTFTPEPYLPTLSSLVEDNIEFKPADGQPYFREFDGGENITILSEKELEMARAVQLLRVMAQQAGKNISDLSWKNEELFLTEISVFIKNNPEITVIQKESIDQTSVITYLYNTDTREVLWGFKPDGSVAYADPHHFDYSTKLSGVLMPKDTYPDVQYDPVDGHWYLYALNKDNKTLYMWDSRGATAANTSDGWRELSNEGNFWEARPPSYEASYIYNKDGITFTINAGLLGLPVEEIYFKDLQVEIMGDEWINACWYRYTEYMGNDVKLEEYKELLRQGKGQVVMVGRDPETSMDFEGLVDPRSGFSAMITSDKANLPLRLNPSNAQYPARGQITVNNKGIPIIILDYPLKALEDDYKKNVPKTMNKQYLYASRIGTAFRNCGLYWGAISIDELRRGGETNHQGEVLRIDVSGIFSGLDKTKETETPLVSVKLRPGE